MNYKIVEGSFSGATTLGIMTLSITTLSIMALSIMDECCYAEHKLCQVSCMLIVVNKPFMLSVAMLSVAIQNVFRLSVVAPF
jgi:hypothetical protein